MNDLQGSSLISFRKSSLVALTLFFLSWLCTAFLMLLGAQVAFLVQLPRLSQLIVERHSMWLVFSTWPDFGFGLFFASAYFINQLVSNLSEDWFDLERLRARIKKPDRRHAVAMISISIFLLPIFIAAGLVVLPVLGILILCCLAVVLFLRWALKTGVPDTIVAGIMAFAIGFVGNLLMPSLSNQTFQCRNGSVELRSGQLAECQSLTAFSEKPLWLLESANGARIIKRHDLKFEKALEASR